MKDEVKLIWHGHSCFEMKYKGWTVVVDPFEDRYVPGCPILHLTAGAVYSTHNHHDHNAVNLVELDAVCPVPPPEFSVEERIVPHDDVNGEKRGMTKVFLFHFGERTIAHLGDIGVIPGEEIIEFLRGVDVLCIPVGGFYTIDGDTAAELAKKIRPRVIVPMHYRGARFGFDVLDTVKPFLSHFGDKTALEENSFTVTDSAPAGVIIPALKA